MKGIYCSWLQPNSFYIDETLFRVGKAKQRKWRKIRERIEISNNKHEKKVNAWAGISNEGKASIQLFTGNMTKELYVSIMEKHLKEMETMARKTFSWYEIMTLNIQVIWQKNFTKNIVK